MHDQLHDQPGEPSDGALPAQMPTSPLLEWVRRGIIGEGELMDGPFGRRRATYAASLPGCSGMVSAMMASSCQALKGRSHRPRRGSGRDSSPAVIVTHALAGPQSGRRDSCR